MCCTFQEIPIYSTSVAPSVSDFCFKIWERGRSLVSWDQTLYQMESEERSGQVRGGVHCTRITNGENAVLIIAPNYHKMRIGSVALIALFSQFTV